MYHTRTYKKSDSNSPQTFSQLVTLLRHPFISLYASYPDQSLTAAGFILKYILENHLASCIQQSAQNASADIIKSKEDWESVVYSLMSGVLVS